MDLWGRARGLAEEAARRSQELTMEAARRSHDLRRLSTGFVSDTAKRSLDLAAHLPDRAGQIKSLAVSAAANASDGAAAAEPDPGELERLGVTQELREFVKGITIDTFKDFPMEDEDEPDMTQVATVSNVRQDLTQWQARHATLVLSTVKEISKLRYKLCPRQMKERKFWRIYFILVDSHVSPYEKRYNEEAESKAAEQEKIDKSSEEAATGVAEKPVAKDAGQKTKTSTSSAEQDLDVFLLGDLGSSDEGPDADDANDADDADFDDDFDKIVSSSAVDSEDESETKNEESKEKDVI